MSAITPTVVLPHVSTCSREVGNLIKSANVCHRPFLDKLPGLTCPPDRVLQRPTPLYTWQPQGPIHHPTLPPPLHVLPLPYYEFAAPVSCSFTSFSTMLPISCQIWC